MNFKKFKILNLNEGAPIKESSLSTLLNVDHIVSIKPINIMIRDNVRRGYWVRLTNGKKYRALEIPEELEALLTSFDPSEDSLANSGNETSTLYN